MGNSHVAFLWSGHTTASWAGNMLQELLAYSTDCNVVYNTLYTIILKVDAESAPSSVVYPE